MEVCAFLEWLQQRIESEKCRSSSKRKQERGLVKRREFYDKGGKVTIEIEKVLPGKR